MLNRRYTAVIFSLLVHGILLLLLLTMSSPLPQPAPATKPAIKSYLYRPKPEVKTAEVSERSTEPAIEKEQPKEPVKETQPPISKETAKADNKRANGAKATAEITDKRVSKAPPVAKRLNDKVKPAKAKKPPKKFSARGQLQKLTNSINNQMLQEEMYRYQQRSSASSMHGAGQAAPHSKKSIDAIQKKADNTTAYSQDMSITKHDDGTCSVTEDLSRVGMEGITATQSFKCGRSKEDSYFKEHMKNVLKKLGK